MLHKKIIENSGFRALSGQEIEATSGGNIVVSAPRPSTGTTTGGAHGFAHGDGAGGLGGGNPFYSLGAFTGLDLEALAAWFESNAEDEENDDVELIDHDGDGVTDELVVTGPSLVEEIDLNGDGVTDVIRIDLGPAPLPSTLEETTFAQDLCNMFVQSNGGSEAGSDHMCGTNLSGQNPDEPGISDDERQERDEQLYRDAADAFVDGFIDALPR